MKLKGLTIVAAFVVLAVAGFSAFYFVSSHKQDEKLNEAYEKVIAAQNLAEEYNFDFDWNKEGCPPKDAVLYAEFLRRKTDAELAVRLASEPLRFDDPRLEKLSRALNRVGDIVNVKTTQCWDMQLRLLR